MTMVTASDRGDDGDSGVGFGGHGHRVSVIGDNGNGVVGYGLMHMVIQCNGT